MGEKDGNIKFGIIIDGEFQEINKPTELSLDNTDIDMTYQDMTRPQSLSFECNVSPLKLLGILLDEKSLIQYCRKTQSNNWLKRHGYPMVRKVR